jgi:acetylornithine/succinyldiaminopimelate/putrescine aminotransferase
VTDIGATDVTRAIAAREDAAQLRTYRRFPLALARGRGSWVESEDGQRFLDLYGGHAVVILGHNHPRLVDALKAQLDELLFYSNLVNLRVRAEAAEALVAVAPPGISHCFFVNSGAEANENSLKLARRATGRDEVLAFHGGFHGRTLAAVNITGLPHYRGNGAPEIPGHHFTEFGDLAAAAAVIESRPLAAVILEPVQSMAGGRVASPEFYQGLRELCERRGTLLIYDEIQTGMGRTGDWFFAPRHGVVPDLISIGKGLAGGVPMAAVLVSERLAANVRYGELGTTFGGGPLACAGLKATLETIAEEKLLANVERESAYLREQLLASPLVEAVHGVGFLLGVRTRVPAVRVKDALFARGVLAGTSEDPNVLRLLPPLSLSRAEIDHFLTIWREVRP